MNQAGDKNEKGRASALDFFGGFSVLTFVFGLMVAVRPELMNREGGSRRRNLSKGPEKRRLQWPWPAI